MGLFEQVGRPDNHPNMKEYFTLEDLEGKVILLRPDINLPLEKETLEIADDTRIREVIPTIRRICETSSLVILAHQSRPDKWDFTSLEKHAARIEELTGIPTKFMDDVYGERAKKAIKNLEEGILVLDNVRKCDGEQDSKGAEEHSKNPLVTELYQLFDQFVIDAFPSAHRAHCSLMGFTWVLKSAAGYGMDEELTAMQKAIYDPQHPFLVILGGAKYEEVCPLIPKLFDRGVDRIALVGVPGALFLRAIGKSVRGPFAPEQIKEARKVYTRYADKIELPIDIAVDDNGRKEVAIDSLSEDLEPQDIGERTADELDGLIRRAKTVVISGPPGVYEDVRFSSGTRELLNSIARSDSYSLASGGHTSSAIRLFNVEGFSHVTTAGGAFETCLEGGKLPVVEALKENFKRFG